MLRYILLAFLIYKIIINNNIIEGADTECCKGKISEVTRGFHNSSCTYVRGQDGEKEVNGPPEPIQRCMKESDRDQPFNCDGVDGKCDSECVGCSNICPDEEVNECVPTIISKDGEYEEGGYCKNKKCSKKNKEDCKNSDSCNWNGRSCESKKFTYHGEEKKELKKNVGTLLNHGNTEKFKKYANLKCNAFSNNKGGGDLLGKDFKPGTHDGAFSDILPQDTNNFFNENTLIVLLVFLGVSLFAIYNNMSKKNNIFKNISEYISNFFKSGVKKPKLPSSNKSLSSTMGISTMSSSTKR